ncbi:MAG: DNA polymerase III subunit beta [Verrucomicrobia bacterium]|nr:DNA polymerase III subunit beta [Verrucomicrobiota bacterium]
MITISQRFLKQALSGLRTLKVWKQKLPALRCVHVTGHGDTVTLAATTLEEFLCFEGRGTADAPATTLVPYELLADALKSADPETEVQITPGAELACVAAGSRISIPVPAIGVEDFPAIPVAPGEGIALPSPVLSALVEAQHCASGDSHRYLLNSVYLTPHEVVSTDGRQLYRRNGLNLGTPEPGLIFPLSGVPAVLDSGLGAELRAWDLEGTPKAEIRQGPWRWVTKLIAGNYPNFRQVIPRIEDYGTVITVAEADATRLLTVLPRLPGFKESSSPVCLTVTDRGAELHPPTRLPQVRVALDRSTVLGPPVAVQFNAGFLITALKVGFREFRARDDVSPLLMRDDSRLHLWMPIRSEASAPVTPIPSPSATEPVAETQPQPETKAETMVANASRLETREPTAPPSEPAEAPVGDATQHVQRARELLRELNGTLGQLLVGMREAARQHRVVEREYEALKRNLRVLKSVEV